MTEAMAAEKIDVSTLDQSKIVDIDLGSPETKKKMRELSASWATGDPFYVLRDGFVFVLCCRYRGDPVLKCSTNSWAYGCLPRWRARRTHAFAG